MARRDIAIEIMAPIKGLERRLGDSMIDIRNTPHVEDCNAFWGAVQKDYGITLFNTGTSSGTSVAYLPNPVNMIYPADFGDSTVLQVFDATKMYQYAGTASDNFVVDCSGSYSGTYTDFWSACMHNNAMIYCNGVNTVQAKTSAVTTGAVMAGCSLSAWNVVSFKEHLNLYHVTEAGTTSLKRVQWTKAGLLGYTASDWTTGLAGFIDVLDVDGQIMQAEKLGNGAVAIYGEGSVHVQEWVGDSGVYRFTKTLTGLNIPSRRSVVANDALHYIACRDNIYEYRGGRDLRNIGDPIKADYGRSLNQLGANKLFTQFIREDGELRVYIPTGTNTSSCDTCYVCKVNDDYAWWKTSRPYSAHGKYTRGFALKIGDLASLIGAYQNQIRDWYPVSGETVYVLGDMSGRVHKMDKYSYDIAYSGTNHTQNWIFETKDLVAMADVDPLVKSRYELTEYMDNQTRWLNCKFEARGAGSMHVHYSTDNGSSWTEFDESPVAVDGQWAMHTLDLDRSKERLRIRFTNTGSQELTSLRYIKVQFVPEAGVPWA